MTGQLQIDDLGQTLSASTFVVVDLETTGGAAVDAGITEIGAVKVRGGDVIGEFHTLVNPGVAIPPFITALTGISDSTVADAPHLAGVFPSFLEFIAGSTLVAHNAGYDIGFLKGAAARLDHPWPDPHVIDTIRMARAALPNGEVPNRKLSTLAVHFRAPVSPTHRALDDARATVHVFHCLLERLAASGVTRLDDLLQLGPRIAARRGAKRALADGLHDGIGVYAFEDANGKPLYIGKSRNVSTRVRQYFGAAETRDRMERMLDLTVSVRAIPCETEFEALVREHRLLVEHKPPFNRVGVRPERNVWLRLTDEAFPRLSIVRERHPDRGLLHLGPFASRADAELARDAIASFVPVRTCQEPVSVRRPRSACALADMDRCAAPCDHRVSREEYLETAGGVLSLCQGDGGVLVDAFEARVGALAAAERFEEAALVRDRMLAYIQGNSRRQQLDMLLDIPQLVAARRVDSYWEVHVIRHGRLAAAGVVDARCDHRERIAAIVAAAEGVPPGRTITASDVRETNLLRAWLEKDGVRLIEGTIASSYPSAEPLRRRFAKAIEAREQAHTLLAQERKRDYFNARGAS
jgi:DNA polymerase-3 subunit epsilon